MTYTLSDLRKKEVIDICNGARLGFPQDVVIDNCGNVLCLQLFSGGRCLPFFKTEPKSIPWNRIERIAEDTIWVKDLP